jgi:hypothetical protein
MSYNVSYYLLILCRNSQSKLNAFDSFHLQIMYHITENFVKQLACIEYKEETFLLHLQKKWGFRIEFPKFYFSKIKNV